MGSFSIWHWLIVLLIVVLLAVNLALVIPSPGNLGTIEAGAVVGGTSAGAAVMSTPMLTGDEKHPGGARPPAKESSDAYMTIARDNVITAPGFGFITNAVVDQHFFRRKRHAGLLQM